ncbi:esterase-like activity of phytase family protein [Hoeflea sp. G2-23]|uniref:Esterase-like activity of phytase family protein n=1 Tax=Hoeflea algicola TaxID=2983763 RepID=A0ABT3Z8P1_9HYPH|nr:esterase-like activity of phytase family protein [Hoeflea algicola]MCY0148140.1 esterase-like activity of phytase family protein [Hoeflea algicola]
MIAASASAAEMNFNRISSLATPSNMAAGEDMNRETSAEIIAASEDGQRLVYTDSPLGVIGIIDIADPANPKPLGNVSMQPVDGGEAEPTSVTVIGGNAFVAVNTSSNYVEVGGKLLTVDIERRTISASCDLGGQPDSIASAKDGSFLAIAIENERDEDLNNGVLPQMPAGQVAFIDVKDGVADCASLRFSDVTGLAEIAPEDPEPEFVDINSLGETVVTLQENNHIVVLDRAGKVVSHFSAGAVTLENVDLTDERGALRFTEAQTDRKREPDAVGWIDNDHFAIANEGDYEGGSRGWTIFNKNGTVVYDSGMSFEYAIVEAGHYPDKRSDAKGAEPESIEVAIFDGKPYVFVGAERASIIGVYDVSNLAKPVLTQMLPSGIAPEGIVAIPSRNLVASANEADLIEDGGVRSHVMLYQRENAPAAYPQITSAGSDALIGWGALSGLATDADTTGKLYAVNDSFYGYQPTIFTIDATQTPARITSALEITRAGFPAQKLDLEGVTTDGEGGFWLASEGRTDRMVPHALYHVNAKGVIKQEISLPEELLAQEKRFGFEGIARLGDTLWMPVQRPWHDDAKNEVKLVAYNTNSKEWGAVRYQLDAPADKGWVGLSDIEIHGDYAYIIERDNQIGAKAAIKKIFRVALSQMVPAKLGGELPLVEKEEVRDLLDELKALNGYVVDKVEGLAIDANGKGYIVTDNDGVDDSSGETLFFTVDGLAPVSN